MQNFSSVVQKITHGECCRLLLSEKKIQKRVKELGQQISRDYHGRCPILIGVLKGGFVFIADLIRELTIDCEVDFIKISSYGNKKNSSGKIKLNNKLDCQVEGRDIIVVEDIVDSGLSVKFLQKHLSKLKPRTLRFVTLLLKSEMVQQDVNVDYVGFEIPSEFVVGYGLDYSQKLRNLRAVYVLDNEAEKLFD
ncbi:hypoxanthine phosphoribosyltransferase [candidate division KSB1 bacterium]|nr:MAG: hypoxanthine phosphoribosyltransferase [candidate division KSB1 bacterium]RKY91048.1 MAG: hypoxanthine phosphoribosyltransferase [candidate division KSB1 bacterium]